MAYKAGKVHAKELITEFYTQLPQEFSELSYKQVNEICRAPWKFLRKLMHNGKFEEVRFKYFGVFQVFPNRAKHYLKDITEGFKKGRMEPDRYFELKQNLETYINELDAN